MEHLVLLRVGDPIARALFMVTLGIVCIIAAIFNWDPFIKDNKGLEKFDIRTRRLIVGGIGVLLVLFDGLSVVNFITGG